MNNNVDKLRAANKILKVTHQGGVKKDKIQCIFTTEDNTRVVIVVSGNSERPLFKQLEKVRKDLANGITILREMFEKLPRPDGTVIDPQHTPVAAQDAPQPPHSHRNVPKSPQKSRKNASTVEDNNTLGDTDLPLPTLSTTTNTQHCSFDTPQKPWLDQSAGLSSDPSHSASQSTIRAYPDLFDKSLSTQNMVALNQPRGKKFGNNKSSPKIGMKSAKNTTFDPTFDHASPGRNQNSDGDSESDHFINHEHKQTSPSQKTPRNRTKLNTNFPIFGRFLTNSLQTPNRSPNSPPLNHYSPTLNSNPDKLSNKSSSGTPKGKQYSPFKALSTRRTHNSGSDSTQTTGSSSTQSSETSQTGKPSIILASHQIVARSTSPPQTSLMTPVKNLSNHFGTSRNGMGVDQGFASIDDSGLNRNNCDETHEFLFSPQPQPDTTRKYNHSQTFPNKTSQSNQTKSPKTPLKKYSPSKAPLLPPTAETNPTTNYTLTNATIIDLCSQSQSQSPPIRTNTPKKHSKNKNNQNKSNSTPQFSLGPDVFSDTFDPFGSQQGSESVPPQTATKPPHIDGNHQTMVDIDLDDRDDEFSVDDRSNTSRLEPYRIALPAEEEPDPFASQSSRSSQVDLVNTAQSELLPGGVVGSNIEDTQGRLNDQNTQNTQNTQNEKKTDKIDHDSFVGLNFYPIDLDDEPPPLETQLANETICLEMENAHNDKPPSTNYDGESTSGVCVAESQEQCNDYITDTSTISPECLYQPYYHDSNNPSNESIWTKFPFIPPPKHHINTLQPAKSTKNISIGTVNCATVLSIGYNIALTTFLQSKHKSRTSQTNPSDPNYLPAPNLYYPKVSLVGIITRIEYQPSKSFLMLSIRDESLLYYDNVDLQVRVYIAKQLPDDVLEVLKNMVVKENNNLNNLNNLNNFSQNNKKTQLEKHYPRLGDIIQISLANIEADTSQFPLYDGPIDAPKAQHQLNSILRGVHLTLNDNHNSTFVIFNKNRLFSTLFSKFFFFNGAYKFVNKTINPEESIVNNKSFPDNAYSEDLRKRVKNITTNSSALQPQIIPGLIFFALSILTRIYGLSSLQTTSLSNPKEIAEDDNKKDSFDSNSTQTTQKSPLSLSSAISQDLVHFLPQCCCSGLQPDASQQIYTSNSYPKIASANTPNRWTFNSPSPYIALSGQYSSPNSDQSLVTLQLPPNRDQFQCSCFQTGYTFAQSLHTKVYGPVDLYHTASTDRHIPPSYNLQLWYSNYFRNLVLDKHPNQSNQSNITHNSPSNHVQAENLPIYEHNHWSTYQSIAQKTLCVDYDPRNGQLSSIDSTNSKITSTLGQISLPQSHPPCHNDIPSCLCQLPCVLGSLNGMHIPTTQAILSLLMDPKGHFHQDISMVLGNNDIDSGNDGTQAVYRIEKGHQFHQKWMDFLKKSVKLPFKITPISPYAYHISMLSQLQLLLIHFLHPSSLFTKVDLISAISLTMERRARLTLPSHTLSKDSPPPTDIFSQFSGFYHRFSEIMLWYLFIYFGSSHLGYKDLLVGESSPFCDGTNPVQYNHSVNSSDTTADPKGFRPYSSSTTLQNLALFTQPLDAIRALFSTIRDVYDLYTGIPMDFGGGRAHDVKTPPPLSSPQNVAILVASTTLTTKTDPSSANPSSNKPRSLYSRNPNQHGSKPIPRPINYVSLPEIKQEIDAAPKTDGLLSFESLSDLLSSTPAMLQTILWCGELSGEKYLHGEGGAGGVGGGVGGVNCQSEAKHGGIQIEGKNQTDVNTEQSQHERAFSQNIKPKSQDSLDDFFGDDHLFSESKIAIKNSNVNNLVDYDEKNNVSNFFQSATPPFGITSNNFPTLFSKHYTTLEINILIRLEQARQRHLNPQIESELTLSEQSMNDDDAFETIIPVDNSIEIPPQKAVSHQDLSNTHPIPSTQSRLTSILNATAPIKAPPSSFQYPILSSSTALPTMPFHHSMLQQQPQRLQQQLQHPSSSPQLVPNSPSKNLTSSPTIYNTTQYNTNHIDQYAVLKSAVSETVDAFKTNTISLPEKRIDMARRPLQSIPIDQQPARTPCAMTSHQSNNVEMKKYDNLIHNTHETTQNALQLASINRMTQLQAEMNAKVGISFHHSADLGSFNDPLKRSKTNIGNFGSNSLADRTKTHKIHAEGFDDEGSDFPLQKRKSHNNGDVYIDNNSNKLVSLNDNLYNTHNNRNSDSQELSDEYSSQGVKDGGGLAEYGAVKHKTASKESSDGPRLEHNITPSTHQPITPVNSRLRSKGMRLSREKF